MSECGRGKAGGGERVRTHLFPWIEHNEEHRLYFARCACGWRGGIHRDDLRAAEADAWEHEHEEQAGRIYERILAD